LFAIKGLAALIDAFPDQTLKRVLLLYADDSTPLESRLRLGQVISQTIARFANLLGKYPCIVHTLSDMIVRLEAEDGVFESVCGLVVEVLEVDARVMEGVMWRVLGGVRGKSGRGVERVLKVVVREGEGEICGEARRMLLLC
jgi:hypothetical protein